MHLSMDVGFIAGIRESPLVKRVWTLLFGGDCGLYRGIPQKSLSVKSFACVYTRCRGSRCNGTWGF